MRTALDVLTVALIEAPGERLKAFRDGMDRETTTSQVRSGRIDRATWGLAPHQIEQQRRFMQTFGRAAT